ncbi:MAG: hypothetical protein ACTSYA_07220 [Candidatus Kariarchaeaceae archaeon]
MIASPLTVDWEGMPTLKIVLHGPSAAGKTSALRIINAIRKIEDPELVVSELQMLEDEVGRTIFFDKGLFQTPKIKGQLLERFRFQIWTTPGEERHKTQRDIIMKGAHGLLLLLDFDNRSWEENLNAIKFTAEKVKEGIPVVTFINKNDIPSAERTPKSELIDLLVSEGILQSKSKASDFVMTGSCLTARNDLLAILKKSNILDLVTHEGTLKPEHRPSSVNLIIRPLQKLIQISLRKALDNFEKNK